MQPLSVKNKKNTAIAVSALLVAGLAALFWAIWRFPTDRVDSLLVFLSVVTICFSSYLRIQLPRTKIHLTVSDSLIFLAFLLYGGEVAVILSVLETSFTSANFKRQGVAIKLKTVGINILIGATAMFLTALAVEAVYGQPHIVAAELAVTQYFWALTLMALVHFLINSSLVAVFVALKSETPIWKVWNEYCINALLFAVIGAAAAGVSAKALAQINVFVFAVVCGFFALAYIVYKRYVDDVKDTAARAEEAERRRADQAEKHVHELEHYVSELEKSSEALRISREKFRHAAYHDSLTGLPNRNNFVEALDAELDAMREFPERRFAVLFLDLNRFKHLNDSLGHTVGDQLIVNVAARLSELVREQDVFGRFSGDEFAILRRGIIGLVDVIEFAEAVARRVAEPFSLDGRQIFTSVSIGIAFGHVRYEHAEEMLRDADIAMYYAKEREKTYEVFDRDMHTRAVSLLELETDLRFAIKRKEFELFYQPIVNLNDAGLKGFEALLRWNHPHNGMVPPNEFIPVAESTGLIIPMTLEILLSACHQLREWQRIAPEYKNMMVSVNLSVKHLGDPRLIEQITAILDETGFDPACLKLEITESGVMENAETAISTMRLIKSTGVQLSIDDFGTGYSSLSYLHRLPVDTLKIDRSFVSTMEEGSENGEIVRTIIALAKALRLGVVAEGIESIHQFHQLRVLGCEYGQGYLFSRPLPVDEVEKLLDDKNRWRNILPTSEFRAPTEKLTELSLTQ
jgi:diguanylate cyclase (GGDEF)-like protein